MQDVFQIGLFAGRVVREIGRGAARERSARLRDVFFQPGVKLGGRIQICGRIHSFRERVSSGEREYQAGTVADRVNYEGG